MKSKIGILSLGCPRNIVDSETILGRLRSKGASIVDMDKADVAVVNTCGFIDEARRESVDAILDLVELKKEGRIKKIIVCGCLTERYKYDLSKELPEIDAFVGRVSFPAKLPKEQAGSRLVSGDGRENHESRRFAITPKHYAYLKICESCINNCSFCVIPRIKGKFTSLDINSVLKKVSMLDEAKVSEINLIGQDISGYGIDLYGSYKLSSILKKITKKMNHASWLRLLYLHPARVSDSLLRAVRDEAKICKYIDLPIQHINDRILKLMNRNMRAKYIISLIEKSRKIIPQVALRTSVITGFPSETDKEFKGLVKFIQEVRFERLGAFIYSREEATAAARLKKQIPERIKKERFNTLMSAQQKVSSEVNKKFLNTVLDILIDEKLKDYYLGRTQFDAPEVDGQVYVTSKRELKAGEIVKVRINDTLEYDLAGEAL